MVDTPQAKVRYSPPTLRHSARLATDLSVEVSPRRAHSAGFAGRVGTSGAASHIGQARLKGIHRLGRLGSVWREAPQRSPRLEPSYVTITVTVSIMSSSNHAPHRDGKAPASPVPQAPPSPPPTFSPDYWDDFYTGWMMDLQKASQLYGSKGLTNILPDIGPRVEHISFSPPSPTRSASTPPSSTNWSGYGV
ncbi:hypothetical protein Taro_025897 [Colocasia esculenta]|uniref:Uncharacterized protein n=1 Tax=Colocasia esculenta TaxID=4460 RepID=A0A843VPN9_COLES|nr:hypothetical protein [Colocasia esculenta]